MKKKASILAVDDEVGVLSAIQRMLDHEYEVLLATNREEARRLIDEHSVDLAIVDVVLPEGDGFELLEEFRNRKAPPEVIVITGDTYDSDEKLARALRGHAFYFLTKPFETVALEALVKRSLEVRQLQAALRHRSEELERDLQLAREFQARLMPRRPLVSSGWTFACHIDPCDQLGGDFCDYRNVEGQAFFILADIMGHGVGAAMLTGMVATTWSRGLRDRLSLEDVYRMLSELVHDWDDKQFFSAFLGCLDGTTQRLRFINAGHPTPAILSPDGELFFPAEKCPVISPAIESDEFGATEIPFPQGSSLFAFTDGLVEARSPEGEFFGIETVLEKFRDSPPDTLQTAVELLRNHCGKRPVEDDLTMLVVYQERQ